MHTLHNIIFRIPQGAILGLSTNEIMFFGNNECDIVSGADQNTALWNLQFRIDTSFRMNQFSNGHIKDNTGKCHLLDTSTNNRKATIEGVINNSKVKQFLGVNFYINLSFESHIFCLCNKSSKKSHVLARMANHMDLKKCRFFKRAFITSQFNYCSFIWMFHTWSFI